jgi:hypothetical protein
MIVPTVFTAMTQQDEIEYKNEAKNLIAENTIAKQTLYLQLLKIFYINGEKNIGDEIPSYVDLKKMIYSKMPSVNEKDIKDFLLICNLFKITEFKGNFGYFEKDYKEAISLISKI